LNKQLKADNMVKNTNSLEDLELKRKLELAVGALEAQSDSHSKLNTLVEELKGDLESSRDITK
jgi:hypothetical protein